MIDLAAAVGHDVPRETVERLKRYAALIREENERQNLVSRSTLEALWDRHILDSAQLVRFGQGAWLDIGSGAGLPGIVIACLIGEPVTLVEPRRLRAEFLDRAVSTLGLDGRVSVHQAKIERVEGQFDSITARAVASADRILAMSEHLAHSGTRWVLPKGKTAQSELAEVQRNWQCSIRAEKSVTDPESAILVLGNVRAKGKR